MPQPLDLPPQSAPVIISLMKGVLYVERQPALWQALLQHQGPLRDYLAVVGLELLLDEAEGYAFLRQLQPDEGDDDALPRLIPRRPLSYPVSLLCVLLRRRLVEQDAQGGETRLVVSRNELVEQLALFLHASGSEARLVDQIDRHIAKLVEFGFLRKLKGAEEYEVRRIIKALVDADWLGHIEEKLRAYREHAEREGRIR